MVYKEHLMALGVAPGDPNSTAKAYADLKVEMDKEKAVRKTTHIEIATLPRAVKDLQITTDKFAVQIPTLEDKVKHLENKVVDGLNEVRDRELYLEHTTMANNDYKKQNAQLTKKLESKPPWSF
jgi:chromosome segregation ATPase